MIRKIQTGDTKKTIELFYSADPYLHQYLFASNEQTCLSLLQMLFNKPDTIFSKEYCLVHIEHSGAVSGIISLIPGAKKEQEEKNIGKYAKEMRKKVSLKTMFKMMLRNKKFTKYLKNINEDELYIMSLAVDPEYHKRGIGSALLDEAQRRAQQMGLSKVTLFVETGNEAAKKLYTKKGFVVTEEITLPPALEKHNLHGFEKMVLDFA